MGFLLRIYFIGLVAFVPDPSGQKMTVLLVDARQPYVASDGELMPVHHPMLLARADRCSGECAAEKGPVADIVYASAPTPAERADKLQRALAGGGGWVLDQSELRIVLPEGARGSAAPFHIVRSGGAAKRGGNASAEDDAADFNHVADLSEIVGRHLVVDPTLLELPDKGRTVAMMRVASGTVKAQRLSGFTDDVVQFQFGTASQLAAGADLGMPTQTLADRVMVEIPVAGCSVRLEDRNAATGARRAMELAPASCNGGLVEVALVNLPDHGFEGGGEHAMSHASSATAPLIDHHFELFYELAEYPPPRNHRPVPGYVQGARAPRPASPEDADSHFLALLGLGPARGLWSMPQCPVAQLFAR